MMDLSWNKKMKKSEIPYKHFAWLKKQGYINVTGVWVRLSKAGSRAMTIL